MVNNSPTSHADVNEVLNLLLSNVEEILEEQFVGMYLFGSIANGGFDKDSDIDVLVATKDDIPEGTFSDLCAMHERISTLDSPWASQLEVSYIPLEALRRFDPNNNKHPHLDRDRGEKLKWMNHDSDWIIQRYILGERGMTVSGPEAGSLIEPVSPDDLKWAVRDILNGWIKGFLDDSRMLEKRGYQSYTVLTLCRILYTLRHGDVVSKQVAAEWSKQNLDMKWTPLIDRAWEGRQDPGLPARSRDLDETLDFIRYTLERAQ
jgi:predicted nucleotidyltransferase